MLHDSLSPVAPARIRVLVVPVGKIKRSEFLALIKSLNDSPPISLRELCPEDSLRDRMFQHL
jgi:hypothetical protein